MRQNISGGSPFEPIIGFSRAVRVGNAVHLAGTGPVGADNADAEGQTRRVFAIASEALAKAGASFNDVVRTRMYLTHVEDWEAVGRVHGEFFANDSSRRHHGRRRQACSIPRGASKSKWTPSIPEARQQTHIQMIELGQSILDH